MEFHTVNGLHYLNYDLAILMREETGLSIRTYQVVESALEVLELGHNEITMIDNAGRYYVFYFDTEVVEANYVDGFTESEASIKAIDIKFNGTRLDSLNLTTDTELAITEACDDAAELYNN